MAGRAGKRQQAGKAPTPWQRWAAPLAVAFALSSVLGAGAYLYRYLSQPGQLPLRVVEVNGEFSQLRPEEIQKAVVDAIDGGFFSCDMQKLRAAVLVMPWIEDVSIRRIWPDKLSMVVTEQVPLARWGDDALVNVNAGVFRPATLDGFSSLVKLSGPEGTQQRVVAFFQAVVPAARARKLQIREVRLDARRHWWLDFDDGLTVSLGRENIDQRLTQFFRVYPSLMAQPARRPQRVDMRYAHGFAVRWHEQPSDEAVAQQVKSQEKV